MDINKLLKGVNCDCGRTHTCDIEYVYIENNAIQRLGEICGQDRNILLVADENTFAAAGEKTVSALAGKNIRKVIFSGGEILVPNETAIHEVRSALSDADLIVGIGSGVINDISKIVANVSGLPYIIVATKVDKLNATERKNSQIVISGALFCKYQFSPNDNSVVRLTFTETFVTAYSEP